MGIRGGEDKREPFWYLAQGSWGGFSEEEAPELSPEGSEGAGDRMSKDKKDGTEKSVPTSIDACCNISHNKTIPLVLSSPSSYCPFPCSHFSRSHWKVTTVSNCHLDTPTWSLIGHLELTCTKLISLSKPVSPHQEICWLYPQNPPLLITSLVPVWSKRPSPLI